MPIILGSDDFKETVLSHLEKEQIKSSQTDYNKTRNLPSMDEVDQLCATYFKVDKATLFKAHVKGSEARKIAIYGSRVWAKEKNSVIAKHYHCQSNSMVSNVVKSIHEKMKHEVTFSDELNKIRKMLSYRC